jgi:hypothetical protein
LNAETSLLQDTNLLSTNAIYMCKCETPEWFKFFADGHVFVGYGDKVLKQPGDTIYGLTGFYKISGDQIKMEVLQMENDSYIVMLEGKIKNGELSLDKRYVRNTKQRLKPTQFIGPYEKEYVKLNLPKPDW